jgi:glycosyltransferase involved in cell wall biosynthesis
MSRLKEAQPLTLYIDVSAAVHQRAGLARYALDLTRTLIAQYGEEYPFGLFYNGSRHAVPLSGLEAIPARTVRAGYKPWRLAVWAGQLLGLGFDRLLPDATLFHATEHLLLPVRDIPTVLTVHDLVYHLFPAYHKRLNYWFLNAAMPLFVRRASALITVSESSKRDLIRLYGVPADKITVVYEAASALFQPASAAQIAASRARYGLPERYLIALGTIEPRKNLIRLVSALRTLRQQDPQLALVIVGRSGWLYQDFYQELEELDDPRAVLLPGYVPDEQLPAVLSGATALVLASLYEGFGLPILEAMACGTPVVCSNVSSMPELGGSAARYFDPQDTGQMAETIAAVLRDGDLRAEMRQRGLEQAARFSWQRAARETLDVYKRAIQKWGTAPANPATLRSRAER